MGDAPAGAVLAEKVMPGVAVTGSWGWRLFQNKQAKGRQVEGVGLATRQRNRRLVAVFGPRAVQDILSRRTGGQLKNVLGIHGKILGRVSGIAQHQNRLARRPRSPAIDFVPAGIAANPM